MVFQRFHLLPALTAVENVAVPLVQAGESRSTRRSRATELLDAVGLEGRHTHRPGSLSGGEQQRVAIARALAADPAVVIADEPTGELDRETGEQVLDVLTDIAADRAVVIASHDEYTLSRTDRVIKLRDGRRET
jgi:putative ABC transport system ATP-binding protein